MTQGEMHEDETHTDESLVRRLLAEHIPQWAGLPVRRVPSAGTVNALYRLGEEMVVHDDLQPPLHPAEDAAPPILAISSKAAQ